MGKEEEKKLILQLSEPIMEGRQARAHMHTHTRIQTTFLSSNRPSQKWVMAPGLPKAKESRPAPPALLPPSMKVDTLSVSP